MIEGTQKLDWLKWKYKVYYVLTGAAKKNNHSKFMEALRPINDGQMNEQTNG